MSNAGDANGQAGTDCLGALANPPDGGNSNYLQFRKHFRGPISGMHTEFCDKLDYATVEGARLCPLAI